MQTWLSEHDVLIQQERFCDACECVLGRLGEIGMNADYPYHKLLLFFVLIVTSAGKPGTILANGKLQHPRSNIRDPKLIRHLKSPKLAELLSCMLLVDRPVFILEYTNLFNSSGVPLFNTSEHLCYR